MTKSTSGRSRSFKKVALGISALRLSVAIHAQPRDFNIPAGDLKAVLDAYIAETRLQIVYNAADLKGKTSKGVRGTMTPEKALEALIEGTDLKLRRDSSGAVVIFFGEGDRPGISEVTSLERVEVFAKLSHLGDRSRTGTRTDADPMSLPLMVTSVDKDLLKQQQARTLTDALSNVAGVSDISGGGAYAMRGFSAGAMRNGNLQLNSDGADAPVISISKIEVVKGPEAIIAGLAAGYGGVINVITKAPQVQPVTEITASVGSRGYYETGLDVGRPLNEDKSLLGRFIVSRRGAGKTSVGFDGPDGLYVAPSLTWRNKALGTELTAQFEYQNQRKVPDALVLTTDAKVSDDLKPVRVEPVQDGIRQKRNVAMLMWNQRLGEDWDLSVKQSYDGLSNSNRLGSTYPGALFGMPPTTWPTLGSQGVIKYKTSATKVELKTEFETGPVHHKVMLGYDRSQTSVRVSTQSIFITGFDTTTGTITDFGPTLGPIFGIPGPTLFGGGDPREAGVLAMDQLTWGDWTALAGLRHIQYSGHPWSGQAGDFKKLLPSLGLLYRANSNLSLYANAAKGFVPNAGNFNASGGSVAPEHATQYELGLKSMSADKRLSSSLALFSIKQDNVAVQDTNYGNNACGGTVCYTSVPGVTSKGVELELSGEVVKGVGLRANYTYTNKQVPAQQSSSVYYARHQGSLWAQYRFSGDDLGGLWVSTGLQVRSARVGSGPNLLQNPGRSRYDASVGYDLQRWSFVAGVKNLTNKRLYPLTGGFLGQASVMQPREFTLTASYSMN